MAFFMKKILAVFLGASASLCWPTAWAGPVTTEVGSARLNVPLQSAKERRDRGVVKQQYDYSCGSGALATLLTYGLDDPISEQDILTQILAALTKDEEALRKKKGLSLLDLQGVAESRGHKAQGFRLTADALPKIQRPVMVFIRPQGYEHFAVLKGVRNDRAYLADPSLGNIRMPLYQFLHMWLDDKGKGIVFVVERQDGQWSADNLLAIRDSGLPLPELMSGRELLETASPARFAIPQR